MRSPRRIAVHLHDDETAHALRIQEIIQEVKQMVRNAIEALKEETSTPLLKQVESNKAMIAEMGVAVETNKRSIHEMETNVKLKNAECDTLQNKVESLQRENEELRRLNNNTTDMTEEYERARHELAMMNELQRIEYENEQQTLRSALDESARTHEAVVRSQAARHNEQLAEVRSHFEMELSRVLKQHEELVRELEKRIQTERARYRELQEKTHRQVKVLEEQMGSLQQVYDQRVSSSWESTFISSERHLNLHHTDQQQLTNHDIKKPPTVYSNPALTPSSGVGGVAGVPMQSLNGHMSPSVEPSVDQSVDASQRSSGVVGDSGGGKRAGLTPPASPVTGGGSMREGGRERDGGKPAPLSDISLNMG